MDACTDDISRFAGRSVREASNAVTVVVSATSGRASPCFGSISPSVELCDELDNDCDGRIDEDVLRASPCDPEPELEPDPTLTECPEIRRELKPSVSSIPRVMLVVDRSWSMMDSDGWSPIERALSVVTQALEDKQPCPRCSSHALVPLTRPCMARVWRVDGMLGIVKLRTKPVRQTLWSSRTSATPSRYDPAPKHRPAPNQGTPTASALVAAHR